MMCMRAFLKDDAFRVGCVRVGCVRFEMTASHKKNVKALRAWFRLVLFV